MKTTLQQFNTLPMLDKVIPSIKVLVIIILIAATLIVIRSIYYPTPSTGDDSGIKRQRVLDIIDEASQEISRVQRLEAKNAVEAEFLQEDITEVRNKLIQICQDANWMADHLGNSQPATLSNGTVLSVTELKNHAEQQLQQSKVLRARMRAMNQALTLYLENAENARQRWQEIQHKVVLLELQLKSSDDHIKTLRIYEQQSASIVKEEKIDSNLAEAQKLVRDLEKTLRVELTTHEIMAETKRNNLNVEVENTLSTSALINQLRSLANTVHQW